MIRWILGAGLLVALPTSAWADCAWVLWTQTATRTFLGYWRDSPWKPVGSFTLENRDACAVQTVPVPLPGDIVESHPTAMTYRRKDGTLVRYVCLPDTIRPQ